jgi:small-conductance mechanosensitive channel/CRP-like cAMP-binding protein
VTPFWQASWFWPAIGVVVGLPTVLLLLTELQSSLERHGNPLHKVVGLLRNVVVPLIAILVLSIQVADAVRPKQPVANQIIATVLGFLVIVFVLNGVNIALFKNAKTGSWREKMPSIFIDIGRIVLIALGLALVFKIVWGADVGGVFTALGVGSLVIGLALQSAVGPVIAGLFLLFEQPFRLGDWLDADGARGRVVEVNWRSVHLDTGGGIKIIPNSSLAGGSFTNLSRTGGTFPVSTDVTFTTGDPPAAVIALLQGVAHELPQRQPGTTAVAVPLGGTAYRVSFEVRAPSAEGAALALFRMWLWYAARRAGLGLDGNATDDSTADTDRAAAIAAVAPTLYLSAEDAVALQSVVSLERYAAGETIMRPGAIPTALRFILFGSVELRVPYEDDQLPATRVEPGDYVGQTALTREVVLTNQVALTETSVLVIPVDAIDALVQASPQLAKDIGQVIDQRHRDVADAIAAWVQERRAVRS